MSGETATVHLPVKRRNTEINVIRLRERRDGTFEFGPDPSKPRAPRWNNQMTAVVMIKTEQLQPEKWWDMPNLSYLNFRSKSEAYQTKCRQRIARLRIHLWHNFRRVLCCEYTINDNSRPTISRIKLAGVLEKEAAKSEVSELFRHKQVSANTYKEMLSHLDLLASPDKMEPMFQEFQNADEK